MRCTGDRRVEHGPHRFYYVRVLKVMILDKTLDENRGPRTAPLRLPAGALAFTGVLAAAVIALGQRSNLPNRVS